MQALLLGESREVTREPHVTGDASVRGEERKKSSPLPPPLAASPLARASSRGSLRSPLEWRVSSQASGTRHVSDVNGLRHDKGAARPEDYSILQNS